MSHPLPDFNFIKKYIEDSGVTLHSTGYTKSTDKLSMSCNKGHNFSMTFITFKKGHRCAECKGLKKLDYNFIKSEIENDGSTLLSKVYVNAQTKLEIKCPNDHIYSLKWNHIKSGHRCYKCFQENNIGENHSRYNPDRTRRRRSHLLSFNLKNIKVLNDDINYINYLEQQFIDTKNVYDVDHIFPRMAFIDNNLDLIYGTQLIKEICNSRDNLRIILKEENLSKHAKYDQNEFMNWFNTKIQG